MDSDLNYLRIVKVFATRPRHLCLLRTHAVHNSKHSVCYRQWYETKNVIETWNAHKTIRMFTTRWLYNVSLYTFDRDNSSKFREIIHEKRKFTGKDRGGSYFHGISCTLRTMQSSELYIKNIPCGKWIKFVLFFGKKKEFFVIVNFVLMFFKRKKNNKNMIDCRVFQRSIMILQQPAQKITQYIFTEVLWQVYSFCLKNIVI